MCHTMYSHAIPEKNDQKPNPLFNICQVKQIIIPGRGGGG